MTQKPIVFLILVSLFLSACAASSGSMNKWRYNAQGPKAQAAPSSLSQPFEPAAIQQPAAGGQVQVASNAAYDYLNQNAQNSQLPFAQAPTATSQKIKVAILLPLSGENEKLGQSMLKAAQMALFDLGSNAFELIPRDTKGTPDGAHLATKSALQTGAQLILGPVFSSSVRAAKRAASGTNVNIIGFSTDWSLAGGNTFIMGFLPFDQIERIVRYASDQGYQRIGVLYPDTNYGNAVMQAYQHVAAYKGIMTVKTQSFDANSKNISPVLREFADYDNRLEIINQQIRPLKARIQANPNDTQAIQEMMAIQEQAKEVPAEFDAILLPVGGDLARATTNLASHYDLPPSKVRRLGTGLWDDPGLSAEPSMEGGWFAAPSPTNRQDFEKRYLGAFGKPAPRLASLAYDATALSVILAQKGQQQPGQATFTRQDISNPNGFAGIDGIFRFRRNGIAERGLAILEFEDGHIKVRDPAPTTFQNVIYQ